LASRWCIFKLEAVAGDIIDCSICPEERQLENISELLISWNRLVEALKSPASISSFNKRITDISAMEARTVFSIGGSVRKEKRSKS
jgi:hypothetical protein